jgi:hypothetical protein
MATVEDVVAHASHRQVTFEEAMSRWAVVSAKHDPAHGSYVVLADRDPGMTENLAMAEIGYSSPSPWTAWTRDERVPELRDRRGLRTYYDMKRADGTVRGALRLLKTPILAARWYVEPASDSVLDKNIAEFVEKNLFEQLNVPWSRVVEDSLLMCEYGYMPFEKVWAEPYSDNDKVKDGKFRLQKLAARHPMDIRQWYWDDNGGPDGIQMEPTESDGYRDFVDIPIAKLVVFVLEQEAGDLRGTSILRSAYKHYYYKDTLYQIDAIQKERHGIGVPLIKLPPGFNAKDRDLAEDLGRNLRTNERAHIVAPTNWEITFAVLGGNPVDCIPSITHHDMKIKSNILAPFMDEPDVRPDSLDVYYKSTRYIASTVCDTYNHFVIPQLVDFNFARGGYPKLRVRRIGEQEDIRTMSFSFRNFVGAGAIRPDDELEKFLRTELDLPAMDTETTRQPAAPQMGGATDGSPGKPTTPKVGAPRQAAASSKPPRTNAGRDTSGGK